MGVGKFSAISAISLVAGIVVIVGPSQGWFMPGPYPKLVVLAGTLLLTAFACSLVAAFVAHKREKRGAAKAMPAPKALRALAQKKRTRKKSAAKPAKKKTLKAKAPKKKSGSSSKKSSAKKKAKRKRR